MMLKQILVGFLSTLPSFCIIAAMAWRFGRRRGHLEGYDKGSREAWRDHARWATAWRDDIRARQTKNN